MSNDLRNITILVLIVSMGLTLYTSVHPSEKGDPEIYVNGQKFNSWEDYQSHQDDALRSDRQQETLNQVLSPKAVSDQAATKTITPLSKEEILNALLENRKAEKTQEVP